MTTSPEVGQQVDQPRRQDSQTAQRHGITTWKRQAAAGPRWEADSGSDREDEASSIIVPSHLYDFSSWVHDDNDDGKQLADPR